MAEMKLPLKEIVMGLRWDPPEQAADSGPADLDAMCVLFNGQDGIVDVIHPGKPGGVDGAVLHTGDSRTGASEWDDERVFVFLQALPEAVSAVSFVIASATGQSLGTVRGVSCHVSDHLTDHEWVRVEFDAADRHTTHCVATLRRCGAGWSLSRDAHPIPAPDLEALLGRIHQDKKRPVNRWNV
jgi:tellurium resistance protein TerD